MNTALWVDFSGARSLLDTLLKAVLFAQPEEPRAFMAQFYSAEFSSREILTRSMVKSDTDAYMVDSGVAALLSALLTAMVYEEPEDPKAFIVAFFGKKIGVGAEAGSKQAILTTEDCAVCFRMFDKAAGGKATGVLDEATCAAAFRKLKLDGAAVPAGEVTLDAFIAACKVGL